MLERKKPYFLVGFDPSSNYDALEVPVKFREFIEGLVPGLALLLGPSGNTWRVGLAQKNGGMFFQDGWSEFVRDHTLSCGDSLVFSHDGDLYFTVLVFNGSSCEKEDAFSSVCSQSLRYAMPFVRKKKRERESSAVANDVDGVPKRMRSSVAHSESTDKNLELQIDVANENGGQEREAGLLSDESEGDVGCSLKSLVTVAVPLAFHSTEATDEEDVLLTAPEAERVARSFTSSLPNFTKVMKKFNISGSCTLNIPYQFATAYLPNCKVKIVLQNLNGESWTVNSVPGSGTRVQTCHTFCGGWLDFVRDNNINLGDFCIFELVQACELRVHIIRVKRENTEDCSDNETLKAMIDKSWAKLNKIARQDLDKVIHDSSSPGSLSSPKRCCVSLKSVPEEKLAAARFCSSFPHFVKIMKKFNVSGSFTLNIPYKFAMDHLPEIKTEIVLCNLKGKSWTVNSIPTEKAIPGKFVINLGERLEGNVTLRGPSGVGWSVEIASSGDTSYFKNGWNEFVQAYSLKENDVLFFKYAKNMRCFDVLLFDQANFCEKEASYFVKAPNDDHNAESSQKRKEQSSHEGDASKRPRNDDGGNKENSASRSAQAPKPYRMPATDEQKQKVLNEVTKVAAACSGTAFVAVMRKSHVSSGSYLPIPTKWASEYIKSTQQYKLVNLHFEGKQWLVTISYKEKSCGLSVGWKKFVTDNDLQESDAVLFRYYYSSSDTINVKINIFRVLEKGVGGIVH